LCDLNLTPFQDAVRIRGSASLWAHFSPPSQIAFHNPNPGKQLPPIAKSILPYKPVYQPPNEAQ
jgi:hypothetical protein